MVNIALSRLTECLISRNDLFTIFLPKTQLRSFRGMYNIKYTQLVANHSSGLSSIILFKQIVIMRAVKNRTKIAYYLKKKNVITL